MAHHVGLRSGTRPIRVDTTRGSPAHQCRCRHSLVAPGRNLPSRMSPAHPLARFHHRPAGTSALCPVPAGNGLVGWTLLNGGTYCHSRCCSGVLREFHLLICANLVAAAPPHTRTVSATGSNHSISLALESVSRRGY